jgi:hypothetical protein
MPEVRRMRGTIHDRVTQLSRGSSIENEDTEFNEKNDDGNTRDDESNGVKCLYQDECWLQNNFTYDPKPMEFLGRKGTTGDHYHAPTILFLFLLFWPTSLLEKIDNETNCYATHCVTALGNMRRGINWMNLCVTELKAFLAIHMYSHV